jgi:hypothetical protein
MADKPEDLSEIKTRVGILEQQYALVSTRIDNIYARRDRIEHRLDPAPVTSLGKTRSPRRGKAPRAIKQPGQRRLELEVEPGR